MATLPENPTDHTPIVDTLVPFYSNRFWDKFIALLPSPDSSFLAKMMNIFRKISRSRHKRRKPSLPLPLPVNFLDSSLILTDSSKILDILEDIMEHILSSLHHIQKSLLFWKSRAEGTDMQKVRFMILERGPRAFIDGTTQLLHGFVAEGSSMQHLCHSATANISNRIAILTSLQHGLASFLAQFYMEVDKFGDALTKDPDKSLSALLLTINNMFSKLEGSIGHPQSKSMSGGIYSVFMNESNSASLQFEKLPEINQERSQWTECEIRDAINTIYQNLDRLDSYLSFLVSKYQKPRRMTLYWIRYTCGAVGLSVCSAWLLHHSSLMGSSDIDNWIHEAKESTVSFWKDHVEQPIISIRDELFETFRTRHKGVMELEEVQLTANSLHRMLLTFSEQTKGQKFPEDASDQEMLEIVMARYEKELMHPIQNLLGGELARALLIQIQKLKLEIETAMLELNQILRANEINFAILAALPAFFLSLLLLMLARAWVINDKGVEGKGRIARIQRRLLIVEVEKRIMQFQNCMDQGMEEDAWCMFGLLLYSLDRLYKAVERHAQETGEWLSLRQDILDIGKPKVSTSYKLLVTSRLERVYDCLLPSTKRQ